MMDSTKKIPWTTYLGLITGPLFIIVAFLYKNSPNYSDDKFKVFLFFIIFGIFRTITSVYLFIKAKKRLEDEKIAELELKDLDDKQQ
jgi:prolipoprotein diacylglyceryltransferase